MKSAAMFLSLIALLLTLLPPLLFMTGGLPGEAGAGESLMKNLMMGGTLLWFATAPLWMKKEG